MIGRALHALGQVFFLLFGRLVRWLLRFRTEIELSPGGNGVQITRTWLFGNLGSPIQVDGYLIPELIRELQDTDPARDLAIEVRDGKETGALLLTAWDRDRYLLRLMSIWHHALERHIPVPGHIRRDAIRN